MKLAPHAIRRYLPQMPPSDGERALDRPRCHTMPLPQRQVRKSVHTTITAEHQGGPRKLVTLNSRQRSLHTHHPKALVGFIEKADELPGGISKINKLLVQSHKWLARTVLLLQRNIPFSPSKGQPSEIYTLDGLSHP